jgi:hypothetical protein
MLAGAVGQQGACAASNRAPQIQFSKQLELVELVTCALTCSDPFSRLLHGG